jgi:hypothetical protein
MIVLGLPRVVVGQGTAITIKYEVTCATCSVVIERVGTVGNANDAELYGSSLQRDSKGRYYGIAADNSSVPVYDASGKYLTKFGRKGQGPGEFAAAGRGSGGARVLFVGLGDTVYVVDDGRRLSVLSPIFTCVRIVQLPAIPSSLIPLADGKILMRASLAAPNQIGMPLHLLDASGKVIRSFGVDSIIAGARGVGPSSPLGPYIVLADDQRSVWTWHASEYRFEQWALDGTMLASVNVSGVNWMPPYRPPPPVSRQDLLAGKIPVGSPSGNATLLRADADGRLWIYATSPLPIKEAAGGHQVLEVIDTKRRTILVAKAIDFPSTLRPFHGTDLVYLNLRDSDGIATAAVFRLLFK